MSNAPKAHIADLIRRAESLNQDLERFSKSEINAIKTKHQASPSKSSEILAGVIGGGIGFSVGYALGAIGGITNIFTGPFGAIMGIAAAILLWRGQEQLKIERAIKKYEIITSRILQIIRSLPEDTPENIRQQQWEMYYDVTAELEKILLGSISDRHSKVERLNELVEK